MFRDLPQYEQHRPAGGWVLTIPDHWGWEPARTLFAERKVLGCIDEELLSVTIGRGVIRQEVLLAASSKKDSSNLDKSKYKLVEPGDLVYNKMRAWQGAAGGSRYRGIVSPAYIVMRPRDGLMEYFHHLLRTPMFATEAERWSYGITSDQWSLRPEHFKMIRFPVPPAEEQAAIVKYLAHANARIDNAIAAKRRLISLLEEQRQSLVQSILDGVDAPAERLGFHIDLTTGFPYKSDDFTSPDRAGTARLLRGVNVGVGEIGWGDVVAVDEKLAALTGSFRLRPGDLVLGMDRPVISAGVRVAEITAENAGALLVQRVARLRPRVGDLDAKYLALVISSGAFVNYLEPIFTGISVPHLSPKQICDFRLPVPSIGEQRIIVSRVSQETAQMGRTVATVEREIALLQEFRTRLIADVVTGQIDVRAIAATLPDAPEVATVTGDLEAELIDIEGEIEVEA